MGEYYDETLAPLIEEIVPVFVKTTRTTMILIQYETQREKSLYLRMVYLHERRKVTFSTSYRATLK
jgi:hypothetical protein